ncbi:hypothetical protein ACHAXH_002486 [Discostella pseudostelligera]
MNRSRSLFIGILTAAQLHCSESFVMFPTVWSGDGVHLTCVSLFGRKKSVDAPEDLSHLPQNDDPEEGPNDLKKSVHPLKSSRRSFLSVTAASASLLPIPRRTNAAPDKLTNLSDNELKQIILSDIVDKSFLVTADITRSVYDEAATFTDEIDEYTMDKWIKGTKSLFIPSGSRVSLVGDVDVSQAEVSFRFDEDLMFNIPFKPVCSLTGNVVLTRDAKSGLITSYREYWDQSVNDVLKTAKFGKKV